jgi:putative Mg2+ transporter-C (MgtC) family protein
MTLEFILRLAVAAALGGLIGLEREYRAKEAGFRTHFLVALGSALFMVLSMYGFDSMINQSTQKLSYDPSRIASQVVPGIGFIGAGIIIFQKHVVKGLTTAAGLWVTSAIGLTCGAGMFILAAATTVLVLVGLEALHFVSSRFATRSILLTFNSDKQETIQNVLLSMRKAGIDIDSYEMQKTTQPAGTSYQVSMEIKVKREEYQTRIMQFMEKMNGVSIQNIE